MKKLLTIMALLTVVATPALAQSPANGKNRAQIERSVPTSGQSDWVPFGPGDTYGGGAG
jgi:hypothetical protein